MAKALSVRIDQIADLQLRNPKLERGSAKNLSRESRKENDWTTDVFHSTLGRLCEGNQRSFWGCKEEEEWNYPNELANPKVEKRTPAQPEATSHALIPPSGNASSSCFSSIDVERGELISFSSPTWCCALSAMSPSCQREKES